MNSIHAGLAVSVSELKKNPSGVMKKAGSNVVAILNRNKPQSYLVPAEIFALIDMDDVLEDAELAAIIRARMKIGRPSVKVKLNEL